MGGRNTRSLDPSTRSEVHQRSKLLVTQRSRRLEFTIT